MLRFVVYFLDKSTIKEEKSGSRHFFGGEECIYIMDAKSMGNIGRYLNVSMIGL